VHFAIGVIESAGDDNCSCAVLRKVDQKLGKAQRELSSKKTDQPSVRDHFLPSNIL